jgi:hypothetical protein
MIESLGLKSSERMETLVDHGVEVAAGAYREVVSAVSDPRAQLILWGEIHDLDQGMCGPLRSDSGNPASLLLNRYLSFGVNALSGVCRSC